MLPVKLGGLGVRSAVQLAPSAFLALAAACINLVHSITPMKFQDESIPHQEEALGHWSQGFVLFPPQGIAQQKQRTWDTLRVSAVAGLLLENTTDATDKAHLLAASCKESGTWLNALPILSMGLWMDNNTF